MNADLMMSFRNRRHMGISGWNSRVERLTPVPVPSHQGTAKSAVAAK